MSIFAKIKTIRMRNLDKTFLFTSESVSDGHPDKICDQISDAILDEYISVDSEAKVAIECFITTNLLVIGGEVFTTAKNVNHVEIAKRVLNEIGYNNENGFDVENAIYIDSVHQQSPDIRVGVVRETPEEQGAGDQGIVFGYACDETPMAMPLPISLANATMSAYSFCRRAGHLPGCRPDAKCQYTVIYDKETLEPIGIDTILVSMQHDENVEHSTLVEYVKDVIIPTMQSENPWSRQYFSNMDEIKLLVNPTGKFVIGGPEGDTGLTGRKIIVDTYGGRCPHGGGAFSGKDPSKVDRSGAYMARYAAKSMVAYGFAKEMTIQVSYAIGVAKPLSIFVNARGSRYSNEELEKIIEKNFDFSPYGIEKALGLKSPIYKTTATFGHFGRVKPWEWAKNEIVR